MRVAHYESMHIAKDDGVSWWHWTMCMRMPDNSVHDLSGRALSYEDAVQDINIIRDRVCAGYPASKSYGSKETSVEKLRRRLRDEDAALQGVRTALHLLEAPDAQE